MRKEINKGRRDKRKYKEMKEIEYNGGVGRKERFNRKGMHGSGYEDRE